MSTKQESPVHEKWMRLALEEAAKGLGRTSPNPPVGAVLVRDGVVIATGFHEKAGAPHAEIMALRSAAGEDLRDTALYVTLEPCSTTGRTPPCVEAILTAGIREVIVGATDPNPRHMGGGLEWLRQAGIAVTSGVLEADCMEMIRFFRKHILTGRPYVIAKTGMTLDGRITPEPGGSRWITGMAAREDVQRLRAEMDAILVGGETVRRDNPRLTLRGKWAEGRSQPWRVVVTKTGDLPRDAHLFTDPHRERTLLFHVEQIAPVLEDLAGRGVASVLFECGGRLMAEAFSGGWIDEVVFYLAPLIGGGPNRAVEGEGFRCCLGTPEIVRFGDDVRYRAKVIPASPP